MSFGMPNSEQARGISSREPPATPDAPHADTAASTEKNNRSRNVDRNAQRVSRGERHNGNSHRSTAHVDGRAQRNRNAVGVFVEVQLLAQRHVHWNVRGRATSKERSKARFAQAAKNERVGVRLSNNANHNGVGDKRDEEHAAHEHGQKQTILGENLDAVGGNRIVDQAENTERSEADDPTHDRCDSVGDVRENSLGSLGRGAQRNANQNAHARMPGNSRWRANRLGSRPHS